MTETFDKPHLPSSGGTFAFRLKIRTPRQVKRAGERLAIFASAKHGLAGRNWTTRFTCGWITRLGVYRLTGNVHRATAHASR